MAVEADGTLAVHPFEAEPQGAAFADRGRWEEPRVAEIAVVAALVRAVGVVAEIGVCFHAGRNVRREDAAGHDGRDGGQGVAFRRPYLPTDMSAAAVERMHSCALTPAASSERQSAKIRFIMACVFRTGEGAHSAPAGERSARGSLFLRSRAGIVVRVVNVFPSYIPRKK